MTSSSLLSVWKFHGTVETEIKMKVEAEKWMSFASQSDNWTFTGKAIHRETRGDQRFRVSMPTMLNHCHKKKESVDVWGNWKWSW